MTLFSSHFWKFALFLVTRFRAALHEEGVIVVGCMVGMLHSARAAGGERSCYSSTVDGILHVYSYSIILSV